jgi:hypothetical protein
MLHRHPRSTRGSAFITVVIFTTVLFLICASILGWAYTERKLNYRNSLRLEARNAAEAAAEYGFAQIRQKLETRNTYKANAFAVGSDAPLVPATAFFNGSKVDHGTVELAAGIIQEVPAGGGSYYVDPADISNQKDPLRGKYVTRRDISIIAKATVNPPANQGGPVTAYVGQRLSFRGAPLFAHAIFYNMDLEIAPGPNMTVWGPVHANGNIYVSKQSSGGLNFMASVTATGGLYKGFKSVDGTSLGPILNTGAREVSQDNDVFFSNNAGALINLKEGGTWRDQRMGFASETEDTNSSFRSFASNTFNGNLQTKSHGIQTYNPVAIGNYVEDPTPSDGVDNSVNEARAMIEPPLPSTDPAYDPELEAQKLSRKSGLYVAVNPSTTPRTARKPDGTTYTIAAGEVKAFKSDGTEVQLPGSASHSTPGGDPIITIKTDQMTDMRRHSESYSNTTARSASNAYTGKVIDIIEVDMNALKKSVERSVNGSSSTTLYTNYRQTTASTGVAVTAANAIEGMNPSDWNGAIYIESVDAETRQDSGVRLINGRGQVASRSGAVGVANEGLTIATNDAMYVLGHFNADGDIEQVANSATNSARQPEPGERPVALVADAITLLSHPTFDKTGKQEGGWNDALSGLRYNTDSWSNNWSTTPPSGSNRVDGSDTKIIPSTYPGATPSTDPKDVKFDGRSSEISAAFLVGVTPSNKNGYSQNSGGVHNLPRFLEKWTGIAAIRGSIVVMFESRVADEPFNLRVYGPPTRLWGFNSLFGTQNRYPPQTPFVRSYRRVDFTEISNREGDYSSAAAEFAALKAALPTGAGTTGADRTAFDAAAGP